MSQPHQHHAARRWAARLSLAVGVLMLVGKWFAYLITGSSAILSDAIESVVHIAATAFALLSISLSARPPDPKYPYGYGKISYFSAGFEGGMIALAAVAILIEATKGLIAGKEPEKLDQGMLLLVAASVINLVLGFWLIRVGRRTQSLILVADGQHVLTDSYTSFGVLFGVALVWLTHLAWLDPLVAILVGLNILRAGYGLVREAVTGLMDRADPDRLRQIVEALQRERQAGWIDLHHLRAWQAGDRNFVDFHLVVPEDWTVGRLHEVNDACREILRSALGDVTEVNIHFDPEPRGSTRYDPHAPWTAARAVQGPAPIPEASRAGAPAGEAVGG